ncbi:MAG: energy-coupling factor transporter transmembrane protein EcfT [Lachnospiraceae bacterium]|nr:energy-coupling factor transporter transmembrane protein EcfT [Lachnospiraceae bacterium]
MKFLLEGLGESAGFQKVHPMVNVIFYVLVIVINIFSNDPVFLATAFLCAWFYTVILGGVKTMKINLLITLPVAVMMTAINGFFSHNGATVLFFINNNRITLEAFLFGISSACLCVTVILWLRTFQVIMSADKIIYLFGKIASVLGLTLSMVFRFIPLLKERYREIRMGQQCMGRHGKGSLIQQMRQLTKEISILISWSLEASIETSDSMEARGYGLPHRSQFHLFKFQKSDGRLLFVMLICSVIILPCCVLGYTNCYYYPVVRLKPWSFLKALAYLAYVCLMVVPMILDIRGERKWQQLKSKM